MAEPADSTESAESRFSKEMVVVIPLIGSAVAVTFDVGYFHGIDINLFTLFSITEHIVFALEALPAGVLIAVFMAVVYGGDIDRKMMAAASRSLPKSKFILLIPVALILLCIALLYFGLAGAGLIAGILTGVVLTLVRILPVKKSTIVACSGFLLIFTAFAVGWDVGRGYLRRGHFDHSIQIETETLSVKLIRSGDRGILVYTKENQLIFFKWDAVKKLSRSWV